MLLKPYIWVTTRMHELRQNSEAGAAAVEVDHAGERRQALVEPRRRLVLFGLALLGGRLLLVRLRLGPAGLAFGRLGLRAEFRLTRHDHEMTRLDFTFATEPARTADRLREALGARAKEIHQAQAPHEHNRAQHAARFPAPRRGDALPR